MTNFRSVSGDSLTPGEIPYPCVVKASLGEDTKAVRLVKSKETLQAAIEHALSYSDHVIIERYEFALVNRLVCLRACSHYAKFCLFCQKICQREAISSANDFLHLPKFLQTERNFKGSVD